MLKNCRGYENKGEYTGCPRILGKDCGVCSNTGVIEFCPRCAASLGGNDKCMCGWIILKEEVSHAEAMFC